MRVRRARLGEEVVAVVEHRDQAEVGHRRERRPARAQHDAHRAPRHREERAIPLGRLLRPGEDDVSALPQHGRERLVPRAGRARRARTRCCPARHAASRGPPPPRPGRSWAGRAAQQARGRSPAARALDEEEPCGHHVQASSVTAGSGPSAGWLGRPPRAHAGAARPGEDVAERAGPAVGDRPAQPQHGRRQHRLRRDDLAQERQVALVVAGLDAIDDERVGETSGEADPNATPGTTSASSVVGTR